uniref:ATP-dependent DNA helicase PIF1 n=1 Tax=Larimichthys crocea TaxID=215358 RepID=A0A0F8ANU7_LARCR
MYQSLNETQASIFYSVRDWCLKRVWGHNLEPFYYFLSGGAGCGKSHVIKCIYQEATRILRELPRFRDQADMSQPAVLLNAFTSTAAFNISGKTLHSMLKLPRSLKPPYQGLGNALDEAVAGIQDCPADRLHIYATNKEVDLHNAQTVATLHKDFVNIDAHNYRKDPRSGCMMIMPEKIQGSKRDLPDNIMAAQGVRIMLIRNLDVEDGIVNGTFGTISHIVMSEGGLPYAKLIGLQLDNPTAGQRFRKKLLGPSDNLVYIERSEENLSCKKGVVRRQFPIKLAFACTAHKVQGMTMTSAVVCLKRVFEPGMAYVALSRTTSLQGLTITDFEEKKIYADPRIMTALENMNHASFQSARPLLTLFKSVDLPPETLTVIHHNTQGLPSHIVDLKVHHELRRADVLCLTETHLSGSSVSPTFHLEEYNMFTRSRQLSYNTCVDMARKDGGGVAVYCRGNVQAEPRRYMQSVTDLEFLVVKIEAPVKVLIATVYKPPNFPLEKFVPNMKSLLDALDMLDHHPTIVCGDFNEDLLSKGKKTINNLFRSRGYTQLITESTTEKNTLIDHIYISHPDKCLQSGVLQTYYSYHSPVYCILTG